MIKRANEEGSTVEEIAHRYIEAYLEDMKCLHIKEDASSKGDRNIFRK